MNLNEFKNRYLGKQVEFHSFGAGALNQCVDLANQYIKELGLTPIIGTNAKDFKDKFITSEFEWIVNTPEAIIKKGDIPVWNGRVGGGAGHIAIALEDGNLNSFTSLDQNWSQKERVTVENHNYANVSGWLRSKKTGGITVDAKTYEDLVRDATLWKDEHPKTLHLLRENERVNREKDGIISSLRDEVVRLQNEKAELQKANISLIQEKEIMAQAQEADAIHDRDAEIKNMDLEKQITELNKQILELKEEKERPVEEAISHYEPLLEEFFKNLIKGKKVTSWKERFWKWIS
jgi:hypothetical protein